MSLVNEWKFFFALYPYSLRKIKGIFVLGKPEVSVVAFASHDFDVYHLGDALTKKGWHLNTLQFPSRFVFAVSFSHSVFRTVPNSIIINCTWQWRRLLQATCSQGLLLLRRERERTWKRGWFLIRFILKCSTKFTLI